MPPATPGLSVPHARLSGTWQVLRETDAGRPTVALRDDDGAGVAVAYPDDADCGEVAAVVDARAGFVLLTGRFRSLDPVDDLATDGRPTGWIGASELEATSRPRITSSLSDGRLLVVVPDGKSAESGALQLFDDVGSARQAWTGRFPDLDDRMVVVRRLVTGMDLREVARRIGTDGSEAPSP